VIEIQKETADRAMASIQRYTAENLEEEFGELKAKLLLDFFLAEIAPSVYNEAIRDAQRYFQERVGDLDGTYHRVEFDYWKPAGR